MDRYASSQRGICNDVYDGINRSDEVKRRVMLLSSTVISKMYVFYIIHIILTIIYSNPILCAVHILGISAWCDPQSRSSEICAWIDNIL